MNEIELEKIQEEVNARYYISPIMAYQYLKFLLSHIHSLEEKVRRLEREKSEMVKLTKEDMKKLGWSYT